MSTEISQVIVEDLSTPKPAPKPEAPAVQSVEPVAPEATPTPAEAQKPEEPISVRFAALAKREKLIQDKERELKEREAKYKPMEYTKETVKRSPKTALESLGLTYEEFTQAYLNELDGQPTITTEDKVDELYKKLAEKERIEKEREEQAQRELEQKAIDQFKSSLKDHISKETEKYEMINLYEAYDEVYATIEAYFEETGEILDKDKAAQEIEDALFKQAEKIKAAKKLGLQPKIGSEAPEQKEKSSIPATLTNKQTPSSPAIESATKPNQLLTAEESLARAAALLKWK